MKLPLDENLNPVPVVCFGTSWDLTDDEMEPSTRIVRIKAIADSRIWCHLSGKTKEGNGTLLSEGETEYVKVPNGYLLRIQGTVNITEVY